MPGIPFIIEQKPTEVLKTKFWALWVPLRKNLTCFASFGIYKISRICKLSIYNLQVAFLQLFLYGSTTNIREVTKVSLETDFNSHWKLTPPQSRCPYSILNLKLLKFTKNITQRPSETAKLHQESGRQYGYCQKHRTIVITINDSAIVIIFNTTSNCSARNPRVALH